MAYIFVIIILIASILFRKIEIKRIKHAPQSETINRDDEHSLNVAQKVFLIILFSILLFILILFLIKNN